MEITIRKIREEDIPDVVDIQIEGWQTAYKGIIEDSFLNSMNKEERIELRKKDYKQGNFIVAEVENKIVGFCRYNSESSLVMSKEFDCEIRALYVRSECKKQGIGRTLFNYAKNDLRNNKKTKMIIWCLKENYPSRKFYEKMGGEIVGEQNIEFGGKSYKEVGFGYKL